MFDPSLSSTMSSRSPSVSSLSFSPDGSYLAWLSNDAQLRVWDGHRVLPSLQLPGGRHLAVSDVAIAVSDDVKPVVRFVDPSSMLISRRMSSATTDSGPIVALTPPHAPAGTSPGAPYQGLYALVEGFAIRIRSYAGENVAAFNNGAVVFCAAFNAEASRLAVGDNKGNVRLWNFSNHPATSVSVKAHKSFVSSLSFVADGSHLVSGGFDGKVQVWKLRDSFSSVACLKADSKTRDKVYAVAVPHRIGEGHFVAAGGTAATVRVWEVQGSNSEQRVPSEPEAIATHTAHSAAVYALSFSPDRLHVASGSGDGTVRLFGVPSKPVLLSHPEKSERQSSHVGFPACNVEGSFQIKPLDVIIKGQRPDRQLIFCPSSVVTLECPICSRGYDSSGRTPICSGVCGHTFACKGCNERLWERDEHPKCPICRVTLVDVVPNYELLRILAAAKASNSSQTDSTQNTSMQTSTASAMFSPAGSLSRGDYIDLSRLSWTEAPEMVYMTRHSCTLYSGMMDGEVVAIRLPSQTAAMEQSDRRRVQMTETERHITCMKRLRGPHIAQLYGLSRTAAPDNRIVVISELPTGGTLANNLSSLREWGRTLPPETVLSLSLQIVKTVRFLHHSDTSAGWALSSEAIAMAMPIRSDWSVRHRIKLMELGGTISRSECSTDIQRVFPSDYVGYMAPEVLDEDRSAVDNRDTYFRRMCQSDMYSLGVVLWELSTGKRPFEGYRPAQVVAAVVGRGERPGYPPSAIPSEIQSLISRLWSQNPADRPSAKEACDLLETIPSAPPAL